MTLIRLSAILALGAMCIPGYVISSYIISKLPELSEKERSYFTFLLSPIVVSLFTFPIILFGINAVFFSLVGQIFISIMIYLNSNRRNLGKRLVRVDYRFVLLLSIVGTISLFFINNLELPLFTDSTKHFSYIDSIAHTEINKYRSLSQLLPARFYHYGYHLFIAQAHRLTGLPIGELMLASGVGIMILFSVGMLALALTLTSNYEVALLSATLISLTSVFPSFAQNWGKYPALFSLSLMPLPVCLTVRLFRQGLKSYSKSELGVLILSVLIVIFAHWRSTILYAIAAISVYFYYQTRKKQNCQQALIIISLALLCCGLIELDQLDIPVLNKAWWLLVFIIAFFLLIKKRDGYSSLLLIPLLIFGLSRLASVIPLPQRWLQFSHPIDWPFYRIGLFIPATLFLTICLEEITTHYVVPTSRWGAFLLLLGVSLMLFPWQKRFQPDEQYSLVGSRQMDALHWIQENYTNSNVTFLIPGQVALDYIEVSDSGGWINPLTGLEVEVVPALIDFSDETQRNLLCNTMPMIYIDHMNTQYGFDDANLDLALYRLVYDREPVRIVEPICD